MAFTFSRFGLFYLLTMANIWLLSRMQSISSVMTAGILLTVTIVLSMQAKRRKDKNLLVK